MQDYRLPTSTSAVGAIAAAIATLVTLAVAVLLPARTMPNTDPMAQGALSRPAVEIAIVPSRIEVIGFRTAKAKSAHNLAGHDTLPA